MGADEYLGAFSTDADYAQYPQLQAYAQAKYGSAANGKDAVLDFVSEIDKQVRASGRTLRIWADGMKGGAAVTLDPKITVEWWEGRSSPSPEELIEQGHDVLNVSWWPLYYVTGGPLKGLRTEEADMYMRWDPRDFEGPYTLRWFTGLSMAERLAADEPRQLGATLAVWNDDPASPDARPDAVAAGIRPRLAILAQQTWGSPKLEERYGAFRRLAGKVVGVQR
jgi:hexosaminidase